MRQNPHVRICGGPGSATTLVYPTLLRGQSRCEMDVKPGHALGEFLEPDAGHPCDF